MVLSQILIATFVISLLALVGVFTFLLKENWLNKILLVLVALSSGALLGGAFLHLLPEAINELGSGLDVFLVLLLGFCSFFVLEQFLHWRHQHNTTVHQIKPFSYLILVSDGVHNFVDGVVIAASFITGFPVGISTTVAIALHEIPQELGDFGALIYGGLSKRRALTFNYISAITAIVGGITGYFASSFMESYIIYLLPFAAGHFIYIAAADLIPEIKHHVSMPRSIIHFIVFLAGMAIMLLVKLMD